MPFDNIINLEVRAFFFNAATDYLPYYKNFNIPIDKGASLLDVLNRVKTQNPDFSFPNKNIILKVNNKVTTAETSVTTVVEAMGESIQIDPATSYRSNNGLILNDDDFMESFKLLEPYATKEDKAFYETLYTLHYASETTNYNRQYIGDAILVLASKMIAEGNENKEEILKAISDEFDGIRCCEYENNLLNGKDYSETIESLKSMIELKDRATLCDKVNFSKKNHTLELETLEDQNIALYVGDTNSIETITAINEQIQNAGANVITFDMATKRAGQSLMSTHFEMAHTKAGKMLLDALDSGADILVCAKDSDVKIFQNALGSCERSVGRDIELKIISVATLNEMSSVTV